MTVKKENLKEHLDIYDEVLSGDSTPYVSDEQIREFASYLDDIIIDMIKQGQYYNTPNIEGKTPTNVNINLIIKIPVEKANCIIPANVDFATIDDDIATALNDMYDGIDDEKYGHIDFDVWAEHDGNDIKFDIDISRDLSDDDDD
jgi:hypothetical protein